MGRVLGGGGGRRMSGQDIAEAERFTKRNLPGASDPKIKLVLSFDVM